MGTGKINPIESINESPINVTLLKLVHHELGNGLAVLSGYRTLLQRAISAQEQEVSPPDQEVWHQRNEQLLGYLHIMQNRETLLNDFLTQLRELSPGVTYDRFCQNFVHSDLVVLLKHVIERLVPLYPDRTLHVHLPVQELSIMCDPFWIEVTLEHVIKHTIAAHAASSPVDIRLDLSDDYPRHLVQEAKIAIRIKRTLADGHLAKEGLAEMWAPVLNYNEGEWCSAMCHEILQEHGGRIWSEQSGEQEETIFLTLPLMK